MTTGTCLAAPPRWPRPIETLQGGVEGVGRTSGGSGHLTSTQRASKGEIRLRHVTQSLLIGPPGRAPFHPDQSHATDGTSPFAQSL